MNIADWVAWAVAAVAVVAAVSAGIVLWRAAGRYARFRRRVRRRLSDMVPATFPPAPCIAEIAKSDRRLAELEDENEELADELASVQKRYADLRREYDDLEESSADARRSFKGLSATLDDTRARLRKIEHDCAVKTDAIALVQEILGAPEADSADVRRLHAAVAEMVRFIGEDVRAVVAADADITSAQRDSFFGSGLAAWAQTRCKLWLQGRTAVAFVGEYSAGKTSIVNRIIGRSDPEAPRLPVSTRATTAVPTYITGGMTVSYEFVTPDNELKSISAVTFGRVSKDVLETVRGVGSLIKYFVLTLDDRALDGLSILDTPGFNSGDGDDSARTLAVVNECDALFWVVDVNAGDLNRSSLEVIQEHLAKPLYIIINQTDTKSETEVAAVEERVRATLAAAGVPCAGLLRFSQKEPIDGLMGLISDIRGDEGRANYLQSLAAFIDERVEHYQSEIKNAELKCLFLENKSASLADGYNEALRALRRDCEALADMPRYSNSLFGKGDYRISPEKYSQFHDLLEKIGERHGERLRGEYDRQMTTTADMLMAWKTYADLNYRLRRLRECRDALIHKMVKLNEQ